MTTAGITNVRRLIYNSILSNDEKTDFLGFVDKFVGKGRRGKRTRNSAFLRVQKAIGQRAGLKIERQNSSRLSSLSQRSARSTHEERDIVTALERLVFLSQSGKYRTCVPLACLSLLLEAETSSWVVLAVICCHSILWRSLPEDVKSGRDRTYEELTSTALTRVKSSYDSLLDLLALGTDKPAIIEPNSQRQLTHQAISAFVTSFNIPFTNTPAAKPIVALALPNGPILGLACIAVASYYTAVPMNVSSGHDQFRLDIQLVSPNVILVFEADIQRLGLGAEWVDDAGIEIMIVQPKPNLTFTTSPWNKPNALAEPRRKPSSADDISFILFTSGVSGRKKAVPITLHSLLTSVALVIQSWNLMDDDVCLNMMPLYHIGGLLRNLFAPILSGGSTILCRAFDPNLFWDIVEADGPTWYNATPSMHLMILAEVDERMDALSRSQIRFVCSAAGALLPSLAIRLQEAFGCAILPSYGMTECLPIAAPPTDYALDRPGASGISAGPELAILDEKGVRQYPHIVGRIHIRGPPLFDGYLPDAEGFVRDISFPCISKDLEYSLPSTSNDSNRTFSITSNDISTSRVNKHLNRDGFFDTGDVGYLDSDGYLHVTGRNKELINRGGELISPHEVEDVVMASSQNPGSILYNRISEALAFSVLHDILQEAVGIVLVTPPGTPRVDLRQLHEAIKRALHRSKWPIAILYMDGLPKTNNKVMRHKLGERLGFDSMVITDEMNLAQRHFEAICPPPDTPISEDIPKRLCQIDCRALEVALAQGSASRQNAYTSISPHDGLPAVVLAPNPKLSLFKFDMVAKSRLFAELQATLDGYLIPSKIRVIDTPFKLTSKGFVDIAALQELLRTQRDSMAEGLPPPKEQKLREMFAGLLMCSVDDIDPRETCFFEAGGDSFSAARLLSMLRKDVHVRLMMKDLYQNSTVDKLYSLIESMEESKDLPKLPPPGRTETFSSTRPWLLIAHLLPMTVFHPIKRAFSWTIFLFLFANLLFETSLGREAFGRYFAFLIAAAFAVMSTLTLGPAVGISVKWILIGRYKEGMYPMFGLYHTRWWIVDKVLKIGGKGIFDFSNSTRIAYYRLLGAKIGSGVFIDSGAVLGEYDLLQIGHYVHLEDCICRPFGVEHNTSMYLGAIFLGNNSSVGLKSVVAPGTCLAEDTCIGSNSSSWETKDATEANRELSPGKTPQPHILLQLLIGYPLLLTIRAISFLPSLLLLIPIVIQTPRNEEDKLATVIKSLASAETIGLILLVRSLDVFLRPVLYFSLVVLTKITMDKLYGPLKIGSVSGVEQIFRFRISSARHRDEIQKFRMWLMGCLLPNGDISSLTELLGSHYEPTSMAVRALGARVGSRVTWPRKGPVVQDYDLLEIGDDVDIGTRSHIVTSDGVGSKRVRIEDGAVIADRVVLSPGTTVCRNTVLGSGALTRRNTSYPSDTVWIGSKAGGAVCLSANRSSPRPKVPTSYELRSDSVQQHTLASFDSATRYSQKGVDSIRSQSSSRATTYKRKANCPVWGVRTIVLYSLSTAIFVAFYWTVPTVLALQYLGMLAQSPFLEEDSNFALRLFVVYWLFALVYSVSATILSIFALGSIVVVKGFLIGQRTPGNYDPDRSNYCQRWHLFQTLERVRQNCYDGIGIIGMITGTYYLARYFRALGAHIGKDCALYAGGNASVIFPEPDLLTLGDRVAIDDACLVAHVNSRGNFSLNPLNVGSGSVLRSGSELLSGAQMGENSCLLEHTLAMAGDVVDKGATYQGWPAEEFYDQRAADEYGAGEVKLC